MKNKDNSLNKHIQELGQCLILFRKIQDQSTAKFVASLGGLSLQELNIINIVGDNEPCIMRDIAERAALSLSSITIIMDKLVNAKLVERVRSEEDRRIVTAHLTDEGKKIYFIQIKHIQEVVQKMLSPLDFDEQETFVQLFQKITHAMYKAEVQ